MTPLDTVVFEVARSLPPEQVEALATLLESEETPSGARKSGASSLVPTPGFSYEVGRLLSSWAASEEVGGHGVALALRAALMALESERTDGEIEVVWTGPPAPGMPVRLTSSVIQEVAASAESHLFLVSYAAYKVPAVADALETACDRGVDVHLVLETEKGSGGKLKFDAEKAFGDLVERVSVWQWDLDKRPKLAKGHAVLHAKAAVADARIAFVTSANLTGLGLDENLELGLLVRGGDVPGQISEYLTTLMDEGVLTQVG